MSSEITGPQRRVNLLSPGPAVRVRRRWPIVVALLAVAALASASFAYRDPLGEGAAAAAGEIGDGAAAVWDAWSGWATSLQDAAAAIPEPGPPATVPPPPEVESRSVLMVFGDSVDTAAFALLARPPTGRTELVMLPQTLLAQVPGFGEFTLAEALGFGGADLAGLTIANEMGIRIDDMVVVPPGGSGALGDGLVVDVPVELFVVESDGSRRLITAGVQRLGPDLVELLLTEPGSGDQFDWIRRQEAVWQAVLALVAEDAAAAVRLTAGAGDPAAAADVLQAAAAGSDIGTPPVDRVAMSAARDALVLATDRFGGYRAEHLAHLVIREQRPRVEILNGNGAAGSGIPAAEVLVARGFYVFRSGNADRFDYETSRVIAQEEEAVAAAREAAEALGIEEVYLEARPSLVVDLSIIVGTDLAPREG